MRIFLAGGVSGNLNPLWKITLKQGGGYLDSENVEKFLQGKDMKIYLAGTAPWKNEGLYDKAITEHKPYILESFYYIDKDTERLLPYYGDFLLDSGAFTFKENIKKGEVNNLDWYNYIERYADFVVRNNVVKYFELDIDMVVGYDKVKDFRKTLEKLTNRPCIPVWHNSRGIDEFKRMCDEYSYVALGGIVGKEAKSTYNKLYDAFPWFISEAHKRNTKIHGLGFTNFSRLKQCHFDSVDSTAWTTGNRFGYIYHFNGEKMIKKNVPQGQRIVKAREAALINYLEWIKFQKYAERNL